MNIGLENWSFLTWCKDDTLDGLVVCDQIAINESRISIVIRKISSKGTELTQAY